MVGRTSPAQLTQPVIANEKVIVADKDNPVLRAFAASTGEPVWQFIPGGRIDSSPTIYKGLVYFGASDGFVYCLDLTDGALRWKYQAAPAVANHMYLERMEATHPVHGNVLIMNDRLYTVAGRSMFTDGGIRFLILDALTGRKIKEHLMDDKVPGTDEPLQMQHEILNMPMALSDLLSSNGKKIFMRYQPFDLEGNRLDLMFAGKRYGYEPNTYGPDMKDDSCATRRREAEGRRRPSVQRNGLPGRQLVASHLLDLRQLPRIGPLGLHASRRPRCTGRTHDHVRQGSDLYLGTVAVVLQVVRGIRLSLARQGLRLPGSMECRVADSGASDGGLRRPLVPAGARRTDATGRNQGGGSRKREVQQLMAEQEKALKGKSGSMLLTVDKQSGEILSGYRLPTAPLLDGMAGAYGNLYLSTTDGQLCCLSDDGDGLDALSAEEVEDLNEELDTPVAAEEEECEEAGWGEDDLAFRPRMVTSPRSTRHVPIRRSWAIGSLPMPSRGAWP